MPSVINRQGANTLITSDLQGKKISDTHRVYRHGFKRARGLMSSLTNQTFSIDISRGHDLEIMSPASV